MMSVEEFDTLTDKLRDKIIFLYFHLMGEPLLHPHLPRFIQMAREKGFRTVLTSNGTLLDRAAELLGALPHKIQLSLHSHESNEVTGRESLEGYVRKVMAFSMEASAKGTCVVLRLWNQGGKDEENEAVKRMLEQYVPQPWTERPDGYRLCPNLYLEYDRKFQWPDAAGEETEKREVYCKALIKQIGILADGSLVPCCLDHDGDVVLGNLLTQSLEEILASPRAVAMLDGFRRHTATERLCQTCESAMVGNSFRGKARKGG